MITSAIRNQDDYNGKIIFITGNKHKLEIAESVLGMYNIKVENIDIGLDEIQGTDIELIAAKSALLGAEKLNKPVIKTDVGFEIEELNGFPGAFGKYIFNQLGVEGILKLLEGKKNRKGKAIEVLAYAQPDGKYKTFRMDTLLTIRETPKGTGSVMDQLMEIEGQKSNYGSLSIEEKLDWWKNNDNYFHDFCRWFKKEDIEINKRKEKRNDS